MGGTYITFFTSRKARLDTGAIFCLLYAKPAHLKTSNEGNLFNFCHTFFGL